MPAAARLERCHIQTMIEHVITCAGYMLTAQAEAGLVRGSLAMSLSTEQCHAAYLALCLWICWLQILFWMTPRGEQSIMDTQVSETEAPYLQWSKNIRDVLSWRVNRKKHKMCASCALALWFVYSACVVWASEHVNLWESRFLAWPDRMRMKMSLRKHGNPRRPAQLPSIVTSRHFPSSFGVPWAKVGILPRLPQAWEARPFSSQSTASTLNTSTGYGESSLRHAPQRLWNQRHPSMISLDMIQFDPICG